MTNELDNIKEIWIDWAFDKPLVFKEQPPYTPTTYRFSRPAAQGWMPIESAPRESKAIMVYCADRKNIYVVSWMKQNGFHDGKGWKIFGGNDLVYEIPTHWQPLPQPPKEEE